MKVELDILWLDEEQTKLQDMGLDTDGEASYPKLITFYSIDHIREYTNNGKPSSVVRSGGEEYITDLPYEKVKELIDLQLKS